MKMTLQQHRELGSEIKKFRASLMQKHVLCIGTKTSRESRTVSGALKHIDRMRDVLDCVVCRDYPECSDATKIYYGHQ